MQYTSSWSCLTFATLLLGCSATDMGSRFGADAASDATTQARTDAGQFTTGDGAPHCVGLECKQVGCPSGTTTVTGTVWDPAGKNPIYNVVVYVPNADLAEIPHGPKCDSCGGANVSGSPVVKTLTDAKGQFVLENVPVGTNIPLVVQAGKWRKQVTLPEVKACVENPIVDGTQKTLALPKNKSEGSMPLIALTGGCDPIHTLIQKIGIDPSEFTTRTGNGMVRVYAGKGGSYNGGVVGATDAYELYGTKEELFKYDILINECECSPYPRDAKGDGYGNVAAFLNAGGRVFSSHYHLNFYGESGKADVMLQAAAKWTLWGGSIATGPYLIDTTFPKGQAMDDWLWNLKTVSVWAPGIKTTPKGQIDTFAVGDIGATSPGVSQRWIYPKSGSATAYVSINMPTNVPPDQRCGRAVGTDMHVGNGSLTSMSEQEAALEFMFFDLAACVTDDAKPPIIPQ